MIALGIDIGGSHITAALVDLETRSVIPGSRERRAINSNLDADHILTTWCEVINCVKNSVSLFHGNVGIAMPGPFDYDAGISLIQDQEKFRSIYLLNLKEELASRLNLESGQFRFLNDAAGFLQGEVFGGAAKGHDTVIGLTLGTGLGSAIYVDNKALDADLWGAKFKGGIAEDYLSTRWFVRRYEELSGMQIAGVKDLIDLAGDSAIKHQIFEEFGDTLGEFLIPYMEEHRPEAVVLGGNIANTHALFMPALLQRLADGGQPTLVKIAALKEDASLIGAASCWSSNSDN
jgi:glucokinase